MYGWCFTYEDIELALPFLDELEGVDSDPPDYKRIKTQVYIGNTADCCSSDSTPLLTWVYVFQDLARCAQASATLIPLGVWLPRDLENGCLEPVDVAAKTIAVIRNIPLTDLKDTVQRVRGFIEGNSAVELGQQVVAQFPSLAHATGEVKEVQNELGVVVSTDAASALMQSLQYQTLECEGVVLRFSEVMAGSYLRCIYRGPYYGLSQAWTDFATSLCSPDSNHNLRVDATAPCFHVHTNYGDNTLAADLRTDLYIKIR